MGRGAVVASKPVFVGRTTELLQLEAARDAALAGSTTLVTITGERGVGKTRLIEEVLERSGHPGSWAYCSTDDRDPPYWPLTQLLRSVRDHLGSDVYDQIVDQKDPLLGVLDPQAVPWPQSSSLSSDLDRFRLFDRLLTVLGALAEVQPLFLVIDDVQDADASTLRFLRFLAQSLPTSSLAVFMTLSTGDDGADNRRDVVDSLMIETTSIRLNRFDRRTTASFLGHLSGGDVTAMAAEAAHAATGGNVYLLSEYSRLGSAPHAEAWDRYGPKVESLAVEAFRRLDESAQSVLRWAAIIGNKFDIDVLLGVAGHDGSVVVALDEATQSGVIAPEIGGGFRFSHGLTRQAIYSELDPTERSERHAAVAAALEQRYRGADDVSAQLAHHWLQVGTRPAKERALEHTIHAADSADARYARDDAVSRYRRALQLLDELGDRTEQQIDVRLRLGRALAVLSALDEARDVLRIAADRALEIGDSERFSQVALAFPPGLEGVSIVPTADPEQVALRTAALAELPRTDSSLRALLLAGLAVSLYWTRHVAGEAHLFSESMIRQDQLSGEALEIARRLGDDRTMATCLLGRLHAVWGPDYLDERVSLVTELLELARDLGDLDLLASALAWRVLDALDSGDLDTAEDHVQAYSEIANRLGQPLYRRTARQWTASIQVLRGDIDEGVETTFAALSETAGLIGDLYALADATLLQSVQLFLKGDLAPIVEPARMVIASDPRVSINWKVGLMFCLSELGQHDEARALFSELTADNLIGVPRDINWLVCAQLLALTTVTLDDKSVGEQLYDAMQPYAHRDTTHGWGYASYGPVGWTLGLLATMAEDLVAAEDHYRQVLASRSRGPYRMVVELRLAELLVQRDAASEEAVGLLESVVEQSRTWSLERFERAAETTLSGLGHGEKEHPECTIERVASGWLVSAQDLGEHALTANRGIDYLIDLMRHAGRERHALDLAASAETRTARGRPKLTLADDIRATFNDLGDVVDEAARQSYLRRIEQLRDEMQRFEARGRADRAEAARFEIESIEREIRRAVGLGGRVRTVAPESERARVSVTKAIRRALVRLDDEAPQLASHLRSAVTTGTFCSYQTLDNRRWITVR